MKVFSKPKFELIYGAEREVYNTVPVVSATLAPYTISEADVSHLKVLVKAFERAKSPKITLSEKDLDNTVVVRIPKYPLGAFITRDNKSVVNLSVFSGEFVSDYSSVDIYSLFLYGISLNHFMKDNVFDESVKDVITEFLIHTFMKLFAKKHGLLGSYSYLISYMQCIIALYVYCGMLRIPFNEKIKNEISTKYGSVDLSKIKINENIITTKGFLNHLKINNIIPISENKFSTQIINTMGISALPVFEDVCRFFSTIMCSNITGGTVFSKFWNKINKKSFEKVIYIANVAYNLGDK